MVRRVVHTVQKSQWRWLIGLLLFLPLNGYILYRLYADWEKIRSMEDWLHPDMGGVVLTAGVQLIGLLVAIYAWFYILQKLGYLVSFQRHFKIYTISKMARLIPGIGWDILSRVYLYTRDGGSKIEVTVATVVEIGIFGLSSAIVASVTGLFAAENNYIHPAILIGVLVLLLLFIPSPLFRRLLAWVNRHHTGAFDLEWYHFINWIMLNTLTIALGGVTFFLFSRALGVVDETALIPLVQGWALTMVAGSLLFWLPVGMGVSNSIVVLILSTMMPTPEALLLLIAWRVWNTLNELVWGLIGFMLPADT